MWGGKAYDGPREGAYFAEMENTIKTKNNSMKKKPLFITTAQMSDRLLQCIEFYTL